MPAFAESSVHQCFYECKRSVTGTTFAEVTTLMIANENQLPAPGDHSDTHIATLVLLNGNERVLARARTYLSGRDLDEVNICATLQQASGAALPSAGLIQVAVQGISPAGNVFDGTGVRSWMKNVVGRISPNNPEVFRGRITGVGKTRCRDLDPLVVTAGRLLEDPEVAQAPAVNAILIERTADEANGVTESQLRRAPRSFFRVSQFDP